jgi:AmmeMemoRadiSam system protein B/AmmeMemoRadiSam system protein A
MNTPLKIILLTLLIVAVITLFIIVKFNIGKEDNLNINNMIDKENEKIIRPSTVAGSFYPADKKELNKQISTFLANVNSENHPNLRAIIVPHAGIVYSGQTAAHGFKQLENQNIRKVILIGPAHHEYLDKFGLSHADIWETPLGEIEIDIEKVNELENNSEFIFADSAINQEHSLELQLPFLQTILKNNWQLIPIIAGQVSEKEINSAAQAISKLIDEETILVISTDLSHYHLKEEANQIDQKCLASIENLEFNPECEACGEVPLKLVFAIGKKMTWQSEILNYSDSGDVSGDEEVVGYVSAILTGEVKTSLERDEYSEEDRQYLLKLARDTIDYAFENDSKLMPLKNIPDKFKEKRGIFVTIHKESKLRGCTGYIEAVEQIYKAVQSNALSAAFNDPRFNPLEEKELKDCEIEISILTIPQKTELKKIKENIDGVIIKQDNNQATYLPQVWENISGPAEFYGSLCIKAGLQADCYTDPETEFYKYQAEVFNE